MTVKERRALTASRALLPPADSRKLIRRRQAWGADGFDEVWNGVYVVSPYADNQHQLLGSELGFALKLALDGQRGVQVVAGGLNISDRGDDWIKNFRVPDISVFLPGNQAIDKETHWLGGPDFVVEILSKGDASRKKLGFYARVNVRELLFVVRRPWRLELRKRDGDAWTPPAISVLPDSAPLRSGVLDLTFRLVPGPDRPRIEVTHPDGRNWLA